MAHINQNLPQAFIDDNNGITTTGNKGIALSMLTISVCPLTGAFGVGLESLDGKGRHYHALFTSEILRDNNDGSCLQAYFSGFGLMGGHLRAGFSGVSAPNEILTAAASAKLGMSLTGAARAEALKSRGGLKFRDICQAVGISHPFFDEFIYPVFVALNTVSLHSLYVDFLSGVLSDLQAICEPIVLSNGKVKNLTMGEQEEIRWEIVSAFLAYKCHFDLTQIKDYLVSF